MPHSERREVRAIESNLNERLEYLLGFSSKRKRKEKDYAISDLLPRKIRFSGTLSCFFRSQPIAPSDLKDCVDLMFS